MIALYILLGFLGLLLLILFLPAGVRVIYSSTGFTLKLVLGPVRLTILPQKPKQDKKRKPKKKKEKKEKTASQKKKTPEQGEKPKGGKLTGIMEYVPVVLELLGGIRRRILVRKLVLLVNLVGDDPCDLALLYGKASGAVGGIMPLLEQAFRVRKRDVQIFCDFMAEQTEVYVDLEMVVCPARMLVLFLRYGWKFLKIFLNQKSDKAV